MEKEPGTGHSRDRAFQGQGIPGTGHSRDRAFQAQVLMAQEKRETMTLLNVCTT